MFNDTIKAAGDVTIVVTDKDGNIKEERHIPNMVVTLGKNHIAARIAGLLTTAGQIGAPISHIGFGTSAIVPSLTDTGLLSQVGVRAVTTPTVSENTVTLSASFTGTTANITEAGIFNSLAGTSNLICRTTFGVVPLLSSETLSISWALKIN